LGADVVISYDDYGAPRVSVPNIHISVSHSRESVAVLFADRTCAVDIEMLERDFRKVATHYLSEEEQSLAEQYDLYAEMWCAKEALYKYYSKGELDLVKHLSIKEYNSANGVLVCSILGGEPIEVKIWREGALAIAVID
jgi:phosphopantetheinyl transferase